MKEQQLLIYRGILEHSLFLSMTRLVHRYENRDSEELSTLAAGCVSGLLTYAAEHGFYGNVWHCYLADLLVNDENPYSMSCEIVGDITGTLNQAAEHDLEILGECFSYDFGTMMRRLSVSAFSMVEHYERSSDNVRSGHVYNTRIRDRICSLAQSLGTCTSPREMKTVLTQFYQEYGVGRFGLHKAFRVEEQEKNTFIKPILNIQHVYLDDLIGYESAKKKLIDNTEAFVSGRSANNCLLFGDAGTGKSSCIKGILNQYYDRGLRIIELYKHQFVHLNEVISQIKNRNYKFIIYMDDLSFEEFEIEYKYLKAVIEGGLEKRPKNVLIYATSNRRHLIRESFRDKEERDEELHTNDTVQEKLSLVSRFGVTIYFGAPDKQEFEQIVLALAKRSGITMPDEELLAGANRWELAHGGRSGRCAQQFIDYLSGMAGSEGYKNAFGG